MKKANYVVIGGQYNHQYYGAVPTLIGAKRLANKNKEYWDNWRGWHTPRIYKIEDVVFNDNYDPRNLWSAYCYPKDYAEPVA